MVEPEIDEFLRGLVELGRAFLNDLLKRLVARALRAVKQFFLLAEFQNQPFVVIANFDDLAFFVVGDKPRPPFVIGCGFGIDEA